MVWLVYHEGADPELDVIIHRRGGPGYDFPCRRPDMTECAMWECQHRNACRLEHPSSKAGETRD